MKTPGFIAVMISAVLATQVASTAATVTLGSSTGMQSNGFPNARLGPGTSGGGNFQNSALFAYRVEDILSDTGLALGDLATTTFTFSFDTDGSIDLVDAGGGSSYRIIYTGFVANTGGGAPFNPQILGGSVTEVNTGIADTLAAQTGISGDFFLTGITEGNSSDDWIGFRVDYETYAFQGSNTYQPLLNVTLSTATPVPEPSVALLSGIGALLLLRRRKH